MKKICLVFVFMLSLLCLTSCKFKGPGNTGDIFKDVEKEEVTFSGDYYDSISVFNGSGDKEKQLVFRGKRTITLLSYSASINVSIAISEEKDYISITYYSNGKYQTSSSTIDSVTRDYCDDGKISFISGLDSDEEEYVQKLFDEVNSYWKKTYGYGIR